MATPAPIKNARGVSLLLKVGDGATPTEAFAAPCSINAARGITFTSASNEFPAIDCANPDAIAWTLREKSSLSAAITGAGMLNTPDVALFFAWLTQSTSKNCKIVVDVPATPNGGVIFSGAFHLTDFAITGDRGNKMECSITLASDGPVTSAANS